MALLAASAHAAPGRAWLIFAGPLLLVAAELSFDAASGPPKTPIAARRTAALAVALGAGLTASAAVTLLAGSVASSAAPLVPAALCAGGFVLLLAWLSG